MTNYHSIGHPGDPTLSCGACRQRHVRSGDTSMNTRCNPGRWALISIAALGAAAIAIVPGHVHAAAVSPASIPGEGRGLLRQGGGVPGIRSVASHQAILRQLETEEDDHDHEEEGHDDHDHDEEEASVALTAEEGHDEEEHEDHEDDHAEDDHDDHGDEVEEDHEDDHAEHDHDDHGDEVEGGEHDEDDHSDHDEDEHSGHDDHSDHDEDDHSGHDDHSDHEVEFSSFSAENEKLPWGQVIGATLLVNMATLSGVLIVVATAIHAKVLKRGGHDDASRSHLVGRGLLFDICIPMFAVGALISTAVFLIFPEAMHLIEGGHAEHSDHGEEADAQDDHSGHGHRILQEDSHDDSSESTNAAKFGCAILGGFLLPLVFSIIFHVEKDDFDSSGVKRESSGAEPSADIGQWGSVKTVVDRHLCASVLLGDAFHNFADGIFIGAAFKSCNLGTALSIMMVTLFHEIAQELADFVLLTRYAGLSVLKACILNFVSGLSVCLGGVVFLAADPSNEATGIILAIAGGVYFNVAGCETMPRMETSVKSRSDRFWALFSVILGTIPIGLILLNHQHCG